MSQVLISDLLSLMLAQKVVKAGKQGSLKSYDYWKEVGRKERVYLCKELVLPLKAVRAASESSLLYVAG